MSQASTEVASLTVRLGAVARNYRTFRSLAGPATVAGVVKANGYGLGAAEITRRLLAEGCDTFFVARLEEGIALRPVAPAARIFVLDGAREATAPALIDHRLTPVLNALDEIDAWSAAAAQRGTALEAAIHIDTGMNRLGLPPAELDILAAEAASRLARLGVVLVMSHLACSDEPEAAMNGEQRERFAAALARLPAAPASLAASGGVLLGRDYVFDLVRPGIGLYGGHPQSTGRNPFEPVAFLAGRILQLRRVDKGECVGYGATFRVERPTVLATVALGYADGLMRALGNRGMGAVAGYRAPIAGRMSMDLVTLDVGDVPGDLLAPGTEVEFLGDTISVDEMAAVAGTANYEILTGLAPRIPRRFTDDPRP